MYMALFDLTCLVDLVNLVKWFVTEELRTTFIQMYDLFGSNLVSQVHHPLGAKRGVQFCLFGLSLMVAQYTINQASIVVLVTIPLFVV